jgi:hypothetical protein
MDNHSNIAQIKERLTYKLEPTNIKIDQQTLAHQQAEDANKKERE